MIVFFFTLSTNNEAIIILNNIVISKTTNLECLFISFCFLRYVSKIILITYQHSHFAILLIFIIRYNNYNFNIYALIADKTHYLTKNVLFLHRYT